MKNSIEISYATIDTGSDTGLYEVAYGEPVSKLEAYRWVTSPPAAIRRHLKQGMLLIAKDTPYRVIGFGIVQSDEGSLISRYSDKWSVDGRDIPKKDYDSLENDLFENINGRDVDSYGLGESPLFCKRVNNRHWSKLWKLCEANDPTSVQTLCKMFNYVCSDNRMSSRVIADILIAIAKSYSKKIFTYSDEIEKEIREELILADQVSGVLSAYANGEIDHDTFAEICTNAQNSTANRRVFSFKCIDAMMSAYECDLDIIPKMEDMFNGGISYEGRKAIIKIMKHDIGLNHLLFKATEYNMNHLSYSDEQE